MICLPKQPAKSSSVRCCNKDHQLYEKKKKRASVKPQRSTIAGPLSNSHGNTGILWNDRSCLSLPGYGPKSVFGQTVGGGGEIQVVWEYRTMFRAPSLSPPFPVEQIHEAGDDIENLFWQAWPSSMTNREHVCEKVLSISTKFCESVVQETWNLHKRDKTQYILPTPKRKNLSD